MNSKLFNCKIVLFKKSKLYVKNEVGSWHHEQINIIHLILFNIFKGTKRGVKCNKEYYYDSYISIGWNFFVKYMIAPIITFILGKYC